VSWHAAFVANATLQKAAIYLDHPHDVGQAASEWLERRAWPGWRQRPSGGTFVALPARNLPATSTRKGRRHMPIHLRGLVLTSVLSMLAVHCGGGSTPTSNTPEASSAGSSDPSAQGATQSEVTGDSSPLGGGSSGTRQDQGSTGGALNDEQIARVTESVNSAEVEQARLAQAKSQNEQVRRFAAMMIEHHEQARTQQTALNLGQAESPVSERFQKEARATRETLEAKQGADFDRAYLQAQVEAHQKALDAIQKQLQPSAKSPELRSYLQELMPKVAQHLEQAKTAQQSLQASGQTSGPPSASGSQGQSPTRSTATR
jgi:putative membrane protein